MNTINRCQVVVGRLLEIDVRAGYRTTADVDEMIQNIKQQFGTIAEPTRIVIAADWRRCRVLTPEVSERVTQMLVGTNTRLERSAILHDSTQATSILQVMRIVREANFPNRRVFTDPYEMEAWLSELLTTEERERLAGLLHKPRTLI
jgi:hypothetical protein